MAIAFDAASRLTTTSSTVDGSWTHTPVGTPAGVVVLITQIGTTNEVVGVTYGGVAMTRVGSFQSQAGGGDPTGCYLYELLSGVPSGAQTVAVDINSTQAYTATAVTMTAGTGIITRDSNNGGNGTAANQTLTINFSGTLGGWLALVGYCDGTNTVAGASVNTGTSMFTNDMGNACGYFNRNSGTGGTSTSFTTTSSNASWAWNGAVYVEGTAAVDSAAAISAFPRRTRPALRQRRGEIFPNPPAAVVVPPPATVPDRIPVRVRRTPTLRRRGEFWNYVPAQIGPGLQYPAPAIIEPARRLVWKLRRSGRFFQVVTRLDVPPGLIVRRRARAAIRRGEFFPVVPAPATVPALMRSRRTPQPRRRAGELFSFVPDQVVTQQQANPIPPIIQRRRSISSGRRRSSIFAFVPDQVVTTPATWIAPLIQRRRPVPTLYRRGELLPTPAQTFVPVPFITRRRTAPLRRRGDFLSFVPDQVNTAGQQAWVPGLVEGRRTPPLRRRAAFWRIPLVGLAPVTVTAIPQFIARRRPTATTRRGRLYGPTVASGLIPPGIIVQRRSVRMAARRGRFLFCPPPAIPQLIPARIVATRRRQPIIRRGRIAFAPYFVLPPPGPQAWVPPLIRPTPRCKAKKGKRTPILWWAETQIITGAIVESTVNATHEEGGAAGTVLDGNNGGTVLDGGARATVIA